MITRNADAVVDRCWPEAGATRVPFWAYTDEANYAVFETLVDAPTQVFNVGRYLGRIVRQGERLKFAELHGIFDSLLVPDSLIYPI